jgi:hypothetical protein
MSDSTSCPWNPRLTMRAGCMTCKKKRLKCDETKPTCMQCGKRNVECEGYKKDYKWRTFEETTFAPRPTSKRKPTRSSSFVSSQPLSIARPSHVHASRESFFHYSSTLRRRPPRHHVLTTLLQSNRRIFFPAHLLMRAQIRARTYQDFRHKLGLRDASMAISIPRVLPSKRAVSVPALNQVPNDGRTW